MVQKAAEIISVLANGSFTLPYSMTLSYQKEPSCIHCLVSLFEKRAMRVHSSPNVKESESYVYNAVITVISSVSFAEVKKQLVKKENVHIM